MCWGAAVYGPDRCTCEYRRATTADMAELLYELRGRVHGARLERCTTRDGDDWVADRERRAERLLLHWWLRR